LIITDLATEEETGASWVESMQN